jgi:GNAT superfamily N-acetyltransferase
MADRVLVRAPSVTDAQSIALLSAELGYEAATEAMSSRIARLLRDSDHHLVVADADSQVAGWMQVHAYESLESGFRTEIIGLVVGSQFRRCGIGRLLVQEAINWSKALGADVLVVRSNVIRQESHQFYPAVGFDLIKTQAIYRLRLR